MKSDIEIKKEVLDELSWNPCIDDTNIRVDVNNGIVTQSGSADSYFEKITTEDAAAKK